MKKTTKFKTGDLVKIKKDTTSYQSQRFCRKVTSYKEEKDLKTKSKIIERVFQIVRASDGSYSARSIFDNYNNSYNDEDIVAVDFLSKVEKKHYNNYCNSNVGDIVSLHINSDLYRNLDSVTLTSNRFKILEKITFSYGVNKYVLGVYEKTAIKEDKAAKTITYVNEADFNNEIKLDRPEKFKYYKGVCFDSKNISYSFIENLIDEEMKARETIYPLTHTESKSKDKKPDVDTSVTVDESTSTSKDYSDSKSVTKSSFKKGDLVTILHDSEHYKNQSHYNDGKKKFLRILKVTSIDESALSRGSEGYAFHCKSTLDSDGFANSYRTKDLILHTLSSEESEIEGKVVESDIITEFTMAHIEPVLEKVYEDLDLRNNVVPLFIGNPGMGKTKIIEKFAKEKGAKLVELITSQMSPFEISGIAMPDKDTKKMTYYNFDKLETLKDGDILFFDELLNGNPIVLNACLTILEQRTLISGKKLPNIMIIAAANHQGMVPLTPQIKERFLWYDVKFCPKMFKNYMTKKYLMPSSVSDPLAKLVKKEEFLNNNFYTPRSIEKAIKMIAVGCPTPYSSVIEPMLDKLVHNTYVKKKICINPEAKEPVYLLPGESSLFSALLKKTKQ
jgi:hypothetical protein